MIEATGEGIWSIDSGKPGTHLCISFGVHGNERAPIDAGLGLVKAFESGELSIHAGFLLLVHANPVASSQDRRWSEDGIDLNRCFHPDKLKGAPVNYEERRAQTIAAAIRTNQIDHLVDFHCTVEPGERFLMQHPPVDHAPSARTYELLRAEVLLADPDLNFGGVSLDEYTATRGGVGICYETGWIHDPSNRPSAVREEMQNLLVGLGLCAGEPQRYGDKSLLRLAEVLKCEQEGFTWADGIGQNLQALEKGTALGHYADGSAVTLEQDATLIFPKKKAELLQPGKPMVYLGIESG